jgi:hypothetical protein
LDDDQISELIKATKSFALDFPLFDGLTILTAILFHKFLLTEGTGKKILWGTGVMMVLVYLSLSIVFFYHP